MLMHFEESQKLIPTTNNNNNKNTKEKDSGILEDFWITFVAFGKVSCLDNNPPYCEEKQSAKLSRS
jgi:hypothetical protein